MCAMMQGALLGQQVIQRVALSSTVVLVNALRAWTEQYFGVIQGFCIAMTLEATEAEIMATVFPHPTMSEAMHEATLAAYGRAIHL